LGMVLAIFLKVKSLKGLDRKISYDHTVNQRRHTVFAALRRCALRRSKAHGGVKHTEGSELNI
jgi:hypothetical protein